MVQWFWRRLKCEKCTDNGHKVLTIQNVAHTTIWVRWAKGKRKKIEDTMAGYPVLSKHHPFILCIFKWNSPKLYLHKISRTKYVWGITSCVLSFNVSKMFICIDINHSIMFKPENKYACFIQNPSPHIYHIIKVYHQYVI